VAPARVRPNQRMKLSACGGRENGGRELFLSAAAAGCSLCAIRYADYVCSTESSY
jgi:hypothetical protein